MKHVELFFDYLSPFSYLAFEKFIKERDKFKNFEVSYTPVIMSQVIHAWETKGPAEIAPKRDFLMKQCLRISRKENIPFKIPPSLPFNTLDALRYSCSDVWGDKKIEFIKETYRYIWQKNFNLEDYENYLHYMNNLGFDCQLVESRDVRKKLKLNTKRAIDLKLFGVPTFLVHEKNTCELFWGADSIQDLFNYLNGECSISSSSEYKKYQEIFS